MNLQQLIDETAAHGGGTVTLPAGEHVSGTLFLRSGVHLAVPAGAVLRASEDPADYPVLGKTVNETGTIRALIHAEDCEDIALSGAGTIDGGGNAPLPAGQHDDPSLFRPEMIFLRDCRNVRLEGLRLQHASFWTVHLLRCEDVVIDALTIRNRRDRINTDGIDPDGCKRVRITGCDIEAGDDCIVLKSTEGDPCEDVSAENCRLSTDYAAVKLGTETLADIRQVRVENCRIEKAKIAFGIFLKDGCTIEDITLRGLAMDTYGEFPLFLDHTPRYPDSPEGRIRNVRMENGTLRGPGRLFVQGGYEHCLEGLTIDGLRWEWTGRLPLGKAGKPRGSVRHNPRERSTRPELEPFHLTLANIETLAIRDLRLTDSSGEPPDRGFLYGERLAGTLASNATDLAWTEPAHKLLACEGLTLA